MFTHALFNGLWSCRDKVDEPPVANTRCAEVVRADWLTKLVVLVFLGV